MKITQRRFVAYRFGDLVSLHSEAPPEHEVTQDGEAVPSCPTIYICPEMARELAEHLIRIADDIDIGTPFSGSTIGGTLEAVEQ